ncbi:hypothetical protein F2Q70_00013825 [Brassica cretica]|uniref:Mechanosensitive ion channel protein n=1 Tax=Brassica cretica TaxID=69181 RepID=A0A8S9LYA7_BRACR|nr:hypothetical protein F2Q70_00013825 [Brassica cretica]
MLRKRVLYFVYGIRKPVQNCLWLGLVLIAWHFLFDKKVERETNATVLKYVTKVLVCLLVAVIIWLIKTLLVKVLASSFHMSTYFDRIQESLFTQYVIETLSGPPRVVIHIEEEKAANGMGGAKQSPPGPKTVSSASPQVTIGSGRLQRSPTRVGKSPALSRSGSKKEGGEDDGIRIDHLQRMNTKNVSAWKMKRLMNVIRKGALSTLDEQIDTSTHEDDKATQIRSEFEAKLAARKIFQNVAEPGSRYIYIEDFMRFLTEDESERAMDLFEGASESHKISKSCLKNWVVNAFRERRALALTLNDTKTAVNRLHRIINVLVSIVIVIIWLLILGIATTKFLLVISSQLLLVVFVFGNSCKTIFEAVIFVFVMHPFDVGDRCEIDGVQMIVEEMNILTTVFLRYDNQKIVYPNSLLGTKPIANYYRSPDMQDAIEFFVHIATPHEKITALKQRIISNFMLRKRVLYFVYGIRKPVQNCLWLGLVLIAWHFLFDKKVERETNATVLKYVTKVLVCLLVAVIIWLIKTLLVKVLASSFHMSTYFDRIQESLFTQYVIETLSGPPRVVIHIEEEKVANGMGGAKLSPPGPKTVSSASPQVTIGSGRLQKSPTRIGKSPALSRSGSKKEGEEEEGIRIDHLQRMNTKNVSAWKLKRLMNVIRKGALSTLDEQIDTSTHEDDKATQIRSEFEAKLAARKIFQNVAEPGSSIVIVIIWLLILGIATTKFLLVISSQLLLVVFVFGNSCKTIFEAVIFVFVMHPFDVGDRCEIDGVQMIVEEMNILTTVFLRYDNQKIVYPNSLLGTKPIANYYRSSDMQDAIEFFVHIATPHEKITALKQRIISYVDNKKDHWHPSPMMVFRDMCGLNSVKIAMWPTHKMNHQDMGESLPPAATPITSDRIPLSWTQQRNA